MITHATEITLTKLNEAGNPEHRKQASKWLNL